MADLKVLYYVNQFYGGIGGEEFADHPFEIREGIVGPGVLLQKLLNKAATITNTLICGDNYFNMNEQASINATLTAVEELKPDVFVAGPAFTSGRYGLACMKACVAVAEKFGIPCITGVHPENPAVGMHSRQKNVYVMPTGRSAANMLDAATKIANAVTKISTQGPDSLDIAVDGYMPRSIRKNAQVGEPAPKRAVSALLAKFGGQTDKNEIEMEHFEVIKPPTKIVDLSKATVAVVTEAGIVPMGNPGKLEAARATKWFKYSIDGVDDLAKGQYQSIHGGYDSKWVDLDPDRVLPVDALRAMEKEGVIGKLFNSFYVSCGSVGIVNVMQRIGREIAQDMLANNIQAALLTAT
jgi:glycine reductase complex component B subunit gamma